MRRYFREDEDFTEAGKAEVMKHMYKDTPYSICNEGHNQWSVYLVNKNTGAIYGICWTRTKAEAIKAIENGEFAKDFRDDFAILSDIINIVGK